MASRGKPFTPGNTVGKGRPKGAKNKIPRSVKQRVMEAWDHLESKDMALSDEAEKDPKWFYRTFGRAMIPKDVEVEHSGTVKHEHGLTAEASEIFKELVG